MSEPFWTPLGGQPVDYEGAWAAGTQYAPGDVVVHNGITYLAVNPSLGIEPVPAALGALGAGARLTHSVNQDTVNGATTTLTFDTESYDTDGFHAPANPTRLTVPAGLGGRYLILGQVTVAGNTNHTLHLRLNGATIIAQVGPLGSGGNLDADITAILALVPGDYVEFRVTQVVGANRAAVASSSSPVFSIERLGRTA